MVEGEVLVHLIPSEWSGLARVVPGPQLTSRAHESYHGLFARNVPPNMRLVCRHTDLCLFETTIILHELHPEIGMHAQDEPHKTRKRGAHTIIGTAYTLVTHRERIEQTLSKEFARAVYRNLTV